MLISSLEIKNGEEALGVAVGFINEIRFVELVCKVTVTLSADFCSNTSNATEVRSLAFLKTKKTKLAQ